MIIILIIVMNLFVYTLDDLKWDKNETRRYIKNNQVLYPLSYAIMIMEFETNDTNSLYFFHKD